MTANWLIIDSHIHYLPKEVVIQAASSGTDLSTILRKNRGGVSYKSQDVPTSRMQDIEEIIRVEEDAGVDMAVLTQSPSSQLGLDACKTLNNCYAKIAHNYPGRFIMCGHIPLRQGQDIIDEIERCINSLGFKGMALVSSLPEITLDSPKLWPIYEKISRLNVPIVIHPPILPPMNTRENKYNLCRTIFRESDIAATTVEVMYGVLKDFPDLKFLMPHYGGGMPGQKARLRAWFETENRTIPVEIKSSPKTPRELDELGLSQDFDNIFNKLYFDMAGSGAGWMPMMKTALLMFRADRVCFGTDYPFDVHNSQDIRLFIDNIKKLDIPEDEKRLMLGENVKKLFKI